MNPWAMERTDIFEICSAVSNQKGKESRMYRVGFEKIKFIRIRSMMYTTQRRGDIKSI
jgi:hypothetical protein